MKRSQRAALISLLNTEMLNRGSWCGETHIQKAIFFLQDLLGVDVGFEFVLYRHGPFSFDLRDELASMQADNLVELTVRREGYGPAYIPTAFSKIYLERFPKTIEKYRDQIEFVAEQIGDKGVGELERLATTLFIAHRESIEDTGERAQRLVDLKPHISLLEARLASEQMERLAHRARSLHISG
jgi:hypothetical protein